MSHRIHEMPMSRDAGHGLHSMLCYLLVHELRIGLTLRVPRIRVEHTVAEERMAIKNRYTGRCTCPLYMSRYIPPSRI